jgi:midasin
MEAQDTWHALSFPLSSKIHIFVQQFPEQAQLRDASIDEQLATLSILLKNQKYTIPISRLFSPVLVDLCARWLDDQEQDEAKFAVFGLLLPIHEDLYRYAVILF